ncbi:MAG: YlbF family regulator [Clostridium argentinense]|uniref:UPF0342 protein H9637_04110 n=1 Tax=Clostridium faecium TaxID=2762223 RepID=A0ABR8YPT2_9CLOT|nr:MULTISPECIES: YlbF family regulator [Clostridium]MBD8046234.1 YlbF family regulator [Clostridium faecium]MBS5823661.1 YlbF family regulator [Clostridium argentinense]MDU1347740.1 YlbF family regulator [Clostridium argentinense]
MNIYDKAQEFARVLKECNEVIEYRESLKKIKENADNKKMLDDFRKIQFEAYSEQIEKGELSEDTKKKLESMGSIVTLNPDIGKFLQAERNFGVMWEDIMKILTKSMGIEAEFNTKE